MVFDAFELTFTGWQQIHRHGFVSRGRFGIRSGRRHIDLKDEGLIIFLVKKYSVLKETRARDEKRTVQNFVSQSKRDRERILLK